MFCKQNGEERADMRMILLCFYYNLPKNIYLFVIGLSQVI